MNGGVAKRIVASLVVVAMLSGCATYSGSKATAKAGGIALAGAAAHLAVAMVLAVSSGGCQDTYPGESYDPEACDRLVAAQLIAFLAVVGAFAVGVPLTAGGLIGMAVHDKNAPERAQAEPRAPPERKSQDDIREKIRAEFLAGRDRRLRLARDLVSTAKVAALADDCATVKRIDRQVLAIDADVHKNEFLADIWIKTCLDAASTPTPTPSDAQPAPPVE